MNGDETRARGKSYVHALRCGAWCAKTGGEHFQYGDNKYATVIVTGEEKRERTRRQCFSVGGKQIIMSESISHRCLLAWRDVADFVRQERNRSRASV